MKDCKHVQAGAEPFAQVTIKLLRPDSQARATRFMGPPNSERGYERDVCAYCAGIAMGAWQGPVQDQADLKALLDDT